MDEREKEIKKKQERILSVNWSLERAMRVGFGNASVGES
jgi:hypothetical protein